MYCWMFFTMIANKLTLYTWTLRKRLTLYHKKTAIKNGTSSPVGNDHSPGGQHNVWRHHNLCSSKAGNSELETVIRNIFKHSSSALDKLLGQLGIYATWLSSIAYLQKQLRIFIYFFYATFFSVITGFLIA